MRRLREMRRFVDGVLTCTGQVYTPGAQVMDPDTLEYVDGPPTIHFEGRCLVYPREMDARDIVVGETEYTVTRYNVLLPAGAPVEVGHRVKVTASPDEPALLGLTLVIVDAPLNAWSVARQCVAEVSTT